MIYVFNLVIATELYCDWQIYKNTVFQISEKARTNGPVPLKYKIFEKKNFNPKILINFRDSLKVSLSLMLPQQTEESAVGTMCPHY